MYSTDSQDFSVQVVRLNQKAQNIQWGNDGVTVFTQDK
jgi:hypothetical protein